MKYCKNCGEKIEDKDNFCDKCGTKVKSISSPKKETTQKQESETPLSPYNRHILPAILSFFVPSLGQFVKGQVKWGLIIWLYFILGNLFIAGMSAILGWWFSIILFGAFNLFLWTYQIYDAYNAPEKETEED